MKSKPRLTALYVRTAIFVLALLGVMAMPWAAVAAPDVKATQTGTFPSHPDSRAREGDPIDYTTIISNATGTSDATGVQLNNPTPANTADTGTVTVSPLAFPDTYSTTPNTALNVPVASGVLVNDTGIPLPSAIAASGSTAPVNSGTYTLAADGSFTYTPDTAFQGAATFTYTVTNANSPDDTATVTIMVDDAPTVTGVTPANGDTNVSGNTNITVTFSEPVNVAGNWFKLVGSISGTRNPADTVVTGGPTTYTINPNTDFSSTETVTLTVFAAGVTDQDSFDPPDNMASDFSSSFTVATDTPPTAVDDTKTVNEDSGATAIDVLANDTDPDGGPKNIASVTQPANGAVVPTGGSPGAYTGLTYQPNANYCNNPPGTTLDTFTYTLNGGSTGNVTVTVNCIDDAPTLTAGGGSPSFTEDGPAVAVDPGITVADVDNATLASGTISITGSFQSGQDVLAFTNDGSTMGNIAGSYVAGTGVLTLTSAGATATVAQWQSALRSVTYSNSSQNPNTANRTIGVKVNDGALDSNTVNKTMGVTAVNDAPVLGGVSGGFTYIENDPATAIATALTVSDVDSTTLASATITISANYQSGEDVLSFTNDGSTMGNIAVGSNTGGVLTLTSAGSTATLAQWQSALRAVKYNNTNDNPNTSTRTVSFQANDGGAVNNLSNTVTRTITVEAVNDAPVVTTSGGSASFTEDGPAVVADPGITVTDADNATLASGTISITGNFQSGQDVLAFTNDGSTMGNIGGSYVAGTGVLTLTSAGATATVAQWQSAVRSVTYNNTSQNPNTTARTVSFAVNDGTASSNTATRGVTVTTVNDAPVLGGVSGGFTYIENDPATAIATALTVTDVDSATLSSATIGISANYQSGQDVLSFTNDGSTMGNIAVGSNTGGVLTLTSAGSTATLAQWQNALRAVKYSNTSDDPNTSTRTVSFQANDGGAANNLSNIVTRTISVTAVNDPPTANGFSGLPAQAGIPINYPPGKLGGSDNAEEAAHGTTITIDTNPINVTNGTVTISGDGSFTFTPLPNATTGSFQYRVSDNGNPGSANSAYVTVSFTVAGPAIYFVKSAAVGSGNCTLGNECTLATAVTNIGVATNARIFIEDANNHTGPATLNSGGWLIGQGVTATSFDSFFGINAPAQGTLAARPAVNTTKPTITTVAAATNGINLGSGNTVRGLTVGATTGTKIFGSGFGTLVIGNTALPDVVLSGNGKAMDLATGTFDSTSAFVSVATTSSTSHGIKIGPTVAGTVVFNSTNVSGSATQGIYVTTSTANVNFGTTTIGATTAGEGLRLESNSAGTRTFANLSITNSSAQGIVHTENGTANGGGLTNFTGLTTITNPAGVGILIQKASASNGVTFANVSVSGSGGTGVVLQNNAGAVTFADLDISPDANQRGLQVSNTVTGATGTITTTIGSTITTTGAPGANAVEVVGFSTSFRQQLAMVFDSVSSTGGANNILLTNVSGSIDMNGGALSGSTAAAFNVSGSTATISYDGSITNSTGGISLTSNTGATVSFTGGMSLSTGANAAFTATGGGTVSATQNNTSIVNTLTTTTGTALNVTSTTIDTSGLTFRSITSNGSGTANGIILDTTGSLGGLTVTGNAGSCTVATQTCTGGTISNKTGVDANFATQGTGIYLNSTSGVSLTLMKLNDFQNCGIRGTSVTGFSLTNSIIIGNNGTTAAGGSEEGAVRFDGLFTSGAFPTAVITNCVLGGTTASDSSFADNLRVTNSSGTLNRLVITNTSFGKISIGGDNGLTFSALNNGTVMNTTVQDSVFTNAIGTDADFTFSNNSTMDVVFRRNKLSNNNVNASSGSGLFVLQGGSGNSTVTYDVSCNTFKDAIGIALLVAKGNGSGTMVGDIINNTIGVTGVNLSGSTQGSGIKVKATGSGTHTTLIRDNFVRQYNENGIFIQNNDGSATLNATVFHNLIAEGGPFTLSGLDVDLGSLVSDTSIINVVVGSAGTAGDQNDLSNSDGGNGCDVNLSRIAGAGTQLNLWKNGSASGTAAGVIDDDNTIPANTSTCVAGTVTLKTNPAPDPLPATPPAVASCTVPLLFAPGGVQAAATIPNDPLLSQAALSATVTTALQLWEATGLTKEQMATLRSLSFEVADLPALKLGETDGNRIRVDNNAGGNGWFIGSAGKDDKQFSKSVSATRSYTEPTGAPAGRVDLLTAIMHEMGHALGLPDSYDAKDRDKVMYGFLTNGERRVPATGDALGAKPNAHAGPQFLASPAVSDTLTIGTIPAGKSVTIRHHSTINNTIPSSGSPISSQGTVTGSNFTTVNGVSTQPNTDDPTYTTTSTDPTLTPVTVPPRSYGSAGGPPPATGTVNQAYAGYTFAADGAPTPTYTVQTGTLPPGITLSSGGVLSGTPTTVGTYSGIVVRATNDAGVLDTAPFTITINQVSATISTQVSAGVSLGNSISDTATVTGTSPTGFVTFDLYGPGNGTCTGSPIFTSTTAVNGSGNATSATFTPTAVGTYNWVASYGGDANNTAAAGACGAANESVTISKGATTTGVTTSKTPTVSGESVTFTATVSPVSPAVTVPTGTVQFVVDGTNFGSPATLSGGTAQTSTASLSVSGSPHTVTAQYSGDDKYATSNGSLTGDQTVNKANTTTGVTSSVNPSVSGQSVTFTATIGAVSPGSGTPAGTVQFKVDGSNFGSPVTLSGGTAQISTAALSVTGSPHTIAADYSGDGNFVTSSGSLAGDQTVNKANTTTGVTSSVNPSTAGESVTFTATVAATSPGAGTPTGTVQFVVDGTNFGGPVALSGGTAQTSNASLSVSGSPHTITAQYGGDSNFVASSNSLAGGQVVNNANTTTSVTSSVNPSVSGENVTFTATIAVVSPGTGTPTGTVQFKVDGTNFGSPVTLSGGTAQTSTASLSVTGSPHAIAAQYSGDSNFTSSSGSLSGGQAVNKANTTTSVASSANPSVSGQSVTFTATIGAVSPGTGTPTGTVQFVVDGTNVGSPVAISAGTAQTSASLGAGGSPHTIVAQYSGDSNFVASNGSLTGGQTVNQASTTTGVTSSVNPSKFGQSVTFTATVAATAPGAGTPTGTVQFAVDGTNLGVAVTLSGGTAQASTASITVSGSPHSITATYNGDSNFLGSSGSVAGGQTVNKAVTTTSVTSSANPSTPGQNVTFTATIAVTAPGAGTPTGTVQFAVDGTNLGAPVALSGTGTAQASTSSITSAGSPHTVTATYSGDGNFAGSNGSLSGGQIVGKLTPTINTQASATTALGGTVSDSATLAGGASPTGSITFKLYGPNDVSCGGAAVFTSAAIPVSGNATYSSGNFTPTVAGTYRWIASYSGDTNNNAVAGACNDANESVVVNKGNPAISGTASPATGNIGTSFTDTATLSAGANPTGTITFTVHGPNTDNCATPIFTSTKTVAGNANYTSDAFTPTLPGSYKFVAVYSGDANNNSVATICGVASQTFVVNGPPPTPTPTPTATPAQALNISTRMRTELGDKAMIGGFIITGNASKSVVLRGLGPSLSSFSLSDLLLDPELELRGPNNNLIFKNKNWKDDQRPLIEGTNFQPTDDRESVIVITLNAGAYTALLSGKDGTEGIGLVEIYDTNPAAASELGNISTRGMVRTDDKVMIGGFTLGGPNNATRIAVRGRGPSLSQFNLSPVLADPFLELRNQNGTIMIANDNWQDDPVSAANLTANGLGLSDLKESGIFISLTPPGQFTAILSGKNGGIGIGLVEIYNLK